MRLFYAFLMAAAFSISSLFAQLNENPSVEKRQFVYHLLAGASYELGLNNTSTIRFSGPLQFNMWYESKIYGYPYESAVHETQFVSYLRPSITTEFRNYYNLEKRAAKGKRVTNNSGNYIGTLVNLFGPAIAKTDNLIVPNVAASAGVVWGIQRNYGKRFNFGLSLGPGIGFSDNEIEFAFMGGLSLGFRIGK